MPSFGRRGSGSPPSLARAQKLGIRTSRVSSWSRSKSFNYAARATVILITVVVLNALVSFTILLSRIDIRGESLRYGVSSPRAARHDGAERSPDINTICSPRERHKWRDDLDRHFGELTPGEIPSFAVLLTVNNGYWDFFVNWYDGFSDRVANRSGSPLLVIVAEDQTIHERLKDFLPRPKKSETIILPGYNTTGYSASVKAEDYDSEAYKSLVSTRATHLLNFICSLRGVGVENVAKSEDESKEEIGIKTKDATIVYSDVDTVWLRDPFPYLQTKLFGLKNNHTQKQQPVYDILAAVDDHNYYDVTDFYCTGFLAIPQTTASIAFLSWWEKELQSNPQLNQPIFNTLLRSTQIPEIRHGGLGETEFPPGRLYFDEWEKEGGEREKMMKAETMVVHNNYIIGHDDKKKRFQEHGLWIDEV